MQIDSKFLGVCILISAVLLSSAIVFHGNATSNTVDSSPPVALSPNPVGRYQFHPSDPPGVIWILDTTTGEIKTR